MNASEFEWMAPGSTEAGCCPPTYTDAQYNRIRTAWANVAIDAYGQQVRPDDRSEEETAVSNPSALTTSTFERELDEVIAEIRSVLLEKNRAYGNTALNPIHVFAHHGADLLLRVRADDKLGRIAELARRKAAGEDDADPFLEDAELDLLGYLLLMRMARARG